MNILMVVILGAVSSILCMNLLSSVNSMSKTRGSTIQKTITFAQVESLNGPLSQSLAFKLPAGSSCPSTDEAIATSPNVICVARSLICGRSDSAGGSNANTGNQPCLVVARTN